MWNKIQIQIKSNSHFKNTNKNYKTVVNLHCKEIIKNRKTVINRHYIETSWVRESDAV